MVVSGVIKNITEYGAFVDLGGIDGLLHITDMSWGRVNHPSEVFNVGDEVTVKVLKYNPTPSASASASSRPSRIRGTTPRRSSRPGARSRARW
jgi:predicted RNA-binding protein with RPS1 domain